MVLGNEATFADRGSGCTCVRPCVCGAGDMQNQQQESRSVGKWKTSEQKETVSSIAGTLDSDVCTKRLAEHSGSGGSGGRFDDRSTAVSKNPDEVRPIASISKLLAMLVVLDHKLNFEAASTISQDDARRTVRGAKSRLLVGFALSNRDLFHAALMASDNRAVLALGRSVGLSPTEFAREMTAKAQSLGLRKTTFHDPTGLDYGNVSSPRETVAMLLAALKNPLIAKAVKTRTYVAKTLGAKKRTIDYSNTLRKKF